MKNKKKEPEFVNFMVGGGDESIFIKVPKGKRILTPNGFVIAGETYEENVKRYKDRAERLEKEWKEEEKRYQKYLLKKQKPDFRTWLSIKMMEAKIVVHPEVFNINFAEKRKMGINRSDSHEVYVFTNYEEYRNFFLMYLNSIDNKDIDKAICILGKKGYIVAYKHLCEQIIVRKATEEYYAAITKEQIDAIHAKGKLTPLEAVKEYESFDLCAPGDHVGLAGYRCEFFGVDCHECLLEYASHRLEHDKIDFKLTDYADRGKSRGRVKQNRHK